VRSYSPTPPLPGRASTPPLPSAVRRASPGETDAGDVGGQSHATEVAPRGGGLQLGLNLEAVGREEESAQMPSTPVLPRDGARAAEDGGGGVHSSGEGGASQGQEEAAPASPRLRQELPVTPPRIAAQGRAGGEGEAGHGAGEGDTSRVDTPILPQQIAAATGEDMERDRDDLELAASSTLPSLPVFSPGGDLDSGAEMDRSHTPILKSALPEPAASSSLETAAAEPHVTATRSSGGHGHGILPNANEPDGMEDADEHGDVLAHNLEAGRGGLPGDERVSGATRESVGYDDRPRRSHRKGLKTTTRLWGVADTGRDPSPRRCPSPIPWRRRREGMADGEEGGVELMLEPTMCLALPDGRIVQVPVTRTHFFSTLLDPLLGDYPAATLLLVYRWPEL